MRFASDPEANEVESDLAKIEALRKIARYSSGAWATRWRARNDGQPRPSRYRSASEHREGRRPARAPPDTRSNAVRNSRRATMAIEYERLPWCDECEAFAVQTDARNLG
jgi:hypothetical protein